MLGVHVGGWLIVDRDALLRSLGGAAALGSQVMGGSGALLTEAAFERQVSTLRALVVLAPRKEIPVHAFENYILGSGEASTSLGLNGVASLGKVLRDAATRRRVGAGAARPRRRWDVERRRGRRAQAGERLRSTDRAGGKAGAGLERRLRPVGRRAAWRSTGTRRAPCGAPVAFVLVRRRPSRPPGCWLR